MLNFYVVSAGRDMVNGTDRSTMCRKNSEHHHYKQKFKKNEGPSGNMGFT